MNILVCEDERPLAIAINRILTQAGWGVSWTTDGNRAFDSALSDDFDLIILDILLPNKNGWDICRELRSAKVNTPILMLTALDETKDKVRGLDLGADDYLPKPFEAEELVARARALLRRDQVNRSQVLRIADLEIRRKDRQVSRGNTTIALTRREYDLLEALAVNEGRILSRETILDRVWRNEESYSNTVDVHIASLRRKLDSQFLPKLIHTVVGFGYVLRTQDELT